jgi:hypothetical protein
VIALIAISSWSSAGLTQHCRKFLPGDEPAPAADGDQFPDLVAVMGDGEALPVLNGVTRYPALARTGYPS